MGLQTYIHPSPFTLESGQILPELRVAYHTYGQISPTGNNVVWICHALTANADVEDWWSGLIGKGKAIDSQENFIVCANIIGSCYGSSGPLSMNPVTGKPYFADFPIITIRDMVQAHILLRKHLNIQKIHLLVGGSMGGYQALEWSQMERDRVNRLFLLTTGSRESAWAIAIHTAQRLAIEADPTWNHPTPDAGRAGLKAARAIGMLTYRNYEIFVRTQTDPDLNKTDHFKASSYILHQGEKLMHRFNAQSYWLLTKAMDSHQLARDKNKSESQVLAEITQPTLIIGITSDMLCPPKEQQFLVDHLPNSTYYEIDSPFGHDGFLIEFDRIGSIFLDWMRC